MGGAFFVEQEFRVWVRFGGAWAGLVGRGGDWQGQAGRGKEQSSDRASALMGLTAKRKVWLEEYLQCWNATEAARRAGYKHPNNQGPRLLLDVGIQKAINARLAEKCMTADEVLVRLADMARADIRDFIFARNDGTWSIDWESAEGKTHLIKTAREGKYGLTLELYDAQAALEKIGRAHGLFTEKHELSGPGGGPIEVGRLTDDERAFRIKALLGIEEAPGSPDDD